MGQDRGWQLRQALVDQLKREGRVRSAAVEAALRRVPRELFVPAVPLDEVYRPSDAIVVKRVDGVSVSSASAPDVVAVMLEQLGVAPGQRVLEVGTGTGYNAALLAELVGPDGQVVSVEIDDDLVASARAHLAEAGYGQVQVVLGDGALGFAPGAPFDRVILTVGAGDIAPAWRDQLRAPGGRLVLPLAISGTQRCVAFEHVGDHLVSRSVLNCSFIPLRGLLAAATHRVPLGPHGEMAISAPAVAGAAQLSAEQIYALLTAESSRLASGVRATVGEVAEGLMLWLAAREAGVCSVWAAAEPAAAGVVPELFGSQGKWRASLGLLDRSGVALLGWVAEAPPGNGRRDELVVWAAGPAGGSLGAHLVARLVEWQAAGRPTDAGLRIRAYPRAQAPPATAAAPATILDQRWTRFLLDWPAALPRGESGR